MGKLINKSGIYCLIINNIIRYIGSASDLESRKSNHSSNLRHNKHVNKKLQELFNIYGEDSFTFKVLEYCKKSDLYIREDYYKKLYNDTICNENNINDTKKKIRRGIVSQRYKENFRNIMSGECNPNCTKLNTEKVYELLDMLEAGIKRSIIAKKFNIAEHYISSIVTKKRWAVVVEEWENEKAECAGTQSTSTCANVIAQ